MATDPVASFIKSHPYMLTRQMYSEKDATIIWRRILQVAFRDSVQQMDQHILDDGSKAIRVRNEGCAKPLGALGGVESWIMDYEISILHGPLIQQNLWSISHGGPKADAERHYHYEALQAPFFFLNNDSVDGWDFGISPHDAQSGKTGILTGMDDKLQPRVSATQIRGVIWLKDGGYQEEIIRLPRGCTNAEFVKKVAGWVVRVCRGMGISTAQMRLLGVIFVSQGRFQPILQVKDAYSAI